MTVLAAAFCPAAPVLVPDLAGGAAGEMREVLDACDSVVAELCSITHGKTAEEPTVVVLGFGSDQSYAGDWTASLHAWGVDVRVGAGARPARQLPLSLTIGAWLLDRVGLPAGRRSYQGAPRRPAAIPMPPPGDIVLLVVGDGASTRTPKAPGGFHPEAQGYDESVGAAIAGGAPSALAALDSFTASDVAASGGPAWSLAADWWGETPAVKARVEYAQAPYGVGYVVGLWTR